MLQLLFLLQRLHIFLRTLYFMVEFKIDAIIVSCPCCKKEFQSHDILTLTCQSLYNFFFVSWNAVFGLCHICPLFFYLNNSYVDALFQMSWSLNVLVWMNYFCVFFFQNNGLPAATPWIKTKLWNLSLLVQAHSLNPSMSIFLKISTIFIE